MTRHRVVLSLSFLGTQATFLWLLLGPLLGQPWLRGFRNYFPNDQLSYAAIASNAAKGVSAQVEPLTETGISHYPSAWYSLLGIASRVSGEPVFRTWTFLGLIALGMMLMVLGALAYRFSKLAIAPLLPGLVLLTGTWSMLLNDSWFTELNSHAVIWGPFGTLFSLNAEAIGIALVTVAMGAVLLAGSGARRPGAWVFLAAVILGSIANIQSYAFLTGISLSILFLAAIALLRYPSWKRFLATAIAMISVLTFGSFIAQALGPLPVFALLITTAIPAFAPLVRINPRLSLAIVIGTALAASPQVIRTLHGTLSGDDFLLYRQSSTIDLSVSPSAAITGAIPLLLIFAFTAFSLMASQDNANRNVHQTFTALLLALGGGAIVMAANDHWGFNQEPYRFWLQYSIITALLMSVATAWSLGLWRSQPQFWRPLIAGTGIIAVLAWAISLADVFAFRSFASEQGVLVVEDRRGSALKLAVPEDTGLVLSSRCLDPQLLKLITGAPVVWFNRGLAWPENRTAFDALMDPNRPRDLAFSDLGEVGVAAIITDSSCDEEWRFADARIQPQTISSYGPGSITLWRVSIPS